MRRFIRWSAACLAPALVAPLTACGTTTPAPSTGVTVSPPPEVGMMSSSGTGESNITYRLSNDDRGVTHYVNASPEETWKVLLQVYGDLQIPATSIDAADKRIVGAEPRAPHRLGDQPLRAYIDCGSSMSGPRVDTYDVSFSLASALASAGDSTAVHSRLTASARSREGVSGVPVDCVSTGKLEERVAALVRQKLAR